MSIDTSIKATSIFPVPLDEDYPNSGRVPAGRVAYFGYCRPWCGHDTPRSGASVAEHGEYCGSVSIGRTAPVVTNRGQGWLSVSLWDFYGHGVYSEAEGVAAQKFDHQVRITVETDDGEFDVGVNSAEARSLANALIRAANVLELGFQA